MKVCLAISTLAVAIVSIVRVRGDDGDGGQQQQDNLNLFSQGTSTSGKTISSTNTKTSKGIKSAKKSKKKNGSLQPSGTPTNSPTDDDTICPREPSLDPSIVWKLEPLPGVHPPPEDIAYAPICANPVARDILYESLPLLRLAAAQNVIGNEKTQDSLDATRKIIVQSGNLSDQIHNVNYNHFSVGGDYVETLLMLLRTNSFAAFTLTTDSTNNGFEQPGFEVKSYDPDPNPVNPSLYLRAMRNFSGGQGHRVNFQFDSGLTKVHSWQAYDDILGVIVATDQDMPEKLEYYATSLLYNIFSFAEAVHGALHAIDYLLTTGFQVASRDFIGIGTNTWATYFTRGVPYKYNDIMRDIISPPTQPLNGTDPSKGGQVEFIISAVSGESGCKY